MSHSHSHSLFRRVSNHVVRTRAHRVDGWVSLYCRGFSAGPRGPGADPSDADGEGSDRR